MEVCTRALSRAIPAFNDDIGIENRGVVVYVYCGTERGSTFEELKAYENGVYGNYFD